ncbi:MAG: NADH-quinone oxidoreductase subunit C [Chloroflexota bacterium]
MTEYKRSIADDMIQRFGATTYEFRDEISLVLPPEQIVDAARALRDQHSFELLVEETAVDYWPEQEPRFHVVYRMRSLKHNAIIGIRVPLNGNSPSMPSLVEVYANANWFERELWDMFGIRFDGHPDMRRLVMPEDWVGHPLRKDYPLGYEEVEFTFNFEEIDARKPFAKG